MYGLPNYGYQPNYIPSLTHKTEIVHVNGRASAESYQLPPNSNTLLLDDTAPIVWLIQTDGAGYKTLTPYSIAPYKPEASLEERLKKLEETVNGIQSNYINAGSERRQDRNDKGYAGQRSESVVQSNAQK